LQKGDKHADGKVHTIDTNYYQKLDPVGCIVNHLKSVRLEINIESKRSKVEDSNMLEFVYFLLANAKVLQIMKIQSAMCWKYALEPTGFDSLVGSDGFDPLWCKSPNGPQML
jgi:DNA-directed RNA polymerase specialized sigma54-like protein